MDVWKAFEQNEITHSIAHHLMAVDDLLKNNGYARVTDVARYLNITKGSASITLKNLKERGLLEEDENRFIRLTDKGMHMAHAVQAKRLVIIQFLTDILHVSPRQAEIDACKIEHLISTESSAHILHFLQFIHSNETEGKHLVEAFKHFHHRQGDVETCNLCLDECLYAEICDPQGTSDAAGQN